MWEHGSTDGHFHFLFLCLCLFLHTSNCLSKYNLREGSKKNIKVWSLTTPHWPLPPHMHMCSPLIVIFKHFLPMPLAGAWVNRWTFSPPPFPSHKVRGVWNAVRPPSETFNCMESEAPPWMWGRMKGILVGTGYLQKVLLLLWIWPWPPPPWESSKVSLLFLVHISNGTEPWSLGGPQLGWPLWGIGWLHQWVMTCSSNPRTPTSLHNNYKIYIYIYTYNEDGGFTWKGKYIYQNNNFGN